MPALRFSMNPQTKNLLIVPVVCWVILLAVSCTPAATPAPTSTNLPPTLTPIPPTVTPTALPSPTVQPSTVPVLLKPNGISEVEKFLEGFSKNKSISGVMLIGYQGKILLNKSFGYADQAKKIANTPQTRFRISDFTKQFTAMAIVMLQSQGKLNVKDFMCQYIENCPTAWKDITIHHLLTHNSGLPEVSNELYFRTPPTSQAQLIADIKDIPLRHQPGQGPKYSNTGFGLLGGIIEKTSGMKYEEFLQKSIFTPLNMTNTGVAQKTTSGLALGYETKNSTEAIEYVDVFFVAADGLYSTVEDLYLWDQALYTNKLVSQAYLDQIFTPWVNYNKEFGLNFGYGWVVRNYEGHTFHWVNAGIKGFMGWFHRFPASNMTEIFLFNYGKTDFDFNNFLGEIGEMLVNW